MIATSTVRAAPRPYPRVAFPTLRGLLRTGPGAFGVGCIGLVCVLAVAAPVVARYDPAQQEVRHLLEGPSATHLLGTDDLGRDTLSRLIYGAQPALAVGLIATGLALLVGTALGLVAGYRRGLVDATLMRVMDGLLAVPTLVLALAITSALGPGLANAMLAIGVTGIPVFARLVRGQTLATRGLEYVYAAHLLGASPARVVLRHVLPNILSVIIVQASLSMAMAILAEAGLSFLGLGVQPPAPTWGSMVTTARGYLQRDPWLMLAPGAALCLVVLALNLLGDALRDTLDPRLRGA
jgi:peptide/nickel transport system permease protein